MKITHLSITVEDPRRSATILAEMTNGKAAPFKSPNMEGAFVCMWGGNQDELIEFLPNGYLMYLSERGADFKKTDQNIPYNSTHFQLRTSISLEKIKTLADKYNCPHYLRASKRRGGALYEVWIEECCLVEFTSEEIDDLAVD